MSTLGWIVVAVLAWLALVGFIVLVVRGGAMAERMEQRAAAAYLVGAGADPTPQEWERAHQVAPLHRGSRLVTVPPGLGWDDPDDWGSPMCPGEARARRVHVECGWPPAPVPAFRFGSGPLAGVGLHTSRPWVQR